jgi:hypothetical protein
MKRARQRARQRQLQHASARALPPPRNPVARSPLLGKGGVHEKSVGAKRRRARMALQRQLREGREGDSGE